MNKLSYELAVKLRDAKFPQFGEGKKDWKVEDGVIVSEDSVYFPTLSELITECGERFETLSKDGDGWSAFAAPPKGSECMDTDCCGDIGVGLSPEEAVGNLFIIMNTNEEGSEAAPNTTHR